MDDQQQTTPQAPQPQTSDQSSSPTPDNLAPLVSKLRMPRQSLDSVPTFTPKTFAEQIQFIDDGVAKRPAFYINGAWVDLETLITTLAPIFDPFGQYLDLIHWNAPIGNGVLGAAYIYNEITSGTGSIFTQDGDLMIDTSNVLNSYHGLSSRAVYPGLFVSGKATTIEWTINNIVAQAQNNTESRLYFTTDTGYPTDTTKHIGFKIIADGTSPTGIIIYGSTADGTTEATATLSTYQFGTGVQLIRLKLVYTPGTNCQFYINGTLFGTVSTNLPGTTDLGQNITLKTTSAVQKEIHYGRVLIKQSY